MATDFVKKCGDIIHKIEQMEPTLSDAENKVCDVLCDNIEIIPPDFFAEHTVDELNEHFGGSGDMVVTEKVKKYMELFQEQSFISTSMMDVYAERATDKDAEDIGKILNGEYDEEAEDNETYEPGSEEDIIDTCMDLGMVPPDMFDDYDTFRKYLPKLWPNHPVIGPTLFKKIQKAIND